MKRRLSLFLCAVILIFVLCGCGTQSASTTSQETRSIPAESKAQEAKRPEIHNEAAEYVVYVTKSGSKYHKEDCFHADNGYEMDLFAAVEAGYEPCSSCRPPIVTEDGKVQEQEVLKIEDHSEYVSNRFDPRDIPLDAVESSNLSRVGYDKAESVLVIEFASGGLYAYYDVPESVYNELMSADSLGKYFSANIRNGYKYEKLS